MVESLKEKFTEKNFSKEADARISASLRGDLKRCLNLRLPKTIISAVVDTVHASSFSKQKEETTCQTSSQN